MWKGCCNARRDCGKRGRVAPTKDAQKRFIQFMRIRLRLLQQPAFQRHQDGLKGIGADRSPPVQIPEPIVTPLCPRRSVREGKQASQRVAQLILTALSGARTSPRYDLIPQ